MPIKPTGYEDGIGANESSRQFLNPKSEFKFGDNASSEYGSGIVVAFSYDMIGIKIVYWNEAVPKSERRYITYIKPDELKKI